MFSLPSATKIRDQTISPGLLTPFNVPPFDLIKNEHFLPAIEEGIKREAAEVEAQLREGTAAAIAKGSAVLIGHVQNAATREVLARLLPELESRGIERVPLESLLE